MAETAPDFIEPFIGFRAWGIVERPEGVWLASNEGTIWPWREPLVAACVRTEHRAPDPACTCGIYALSEPDWPYYSYDDGYIVFGVVALYGTVVLA